MLGSFLLQRRENEMIKIIKRGTRDIRECESCGCLFSFDEIDTSFVNEMNVRRYVKCPQCSNNVILEQVENDCEEII